MGKHIETTQRLIIIRPSAFFFFSALTKSRTEKFVLTKFHCALVFQKGNPKNWYVKSYAHVALISSRSFLLFFHICHCQKRKLAPLFIPLVFSDFTFFLLFSDFFISCPELYLQKKKKKKNGHTRYLSRFSFLPGSTRN